MSNATDNDELKRSLSIVYYKESQVKIISRKLEMVIGTDGVELEFT